MENECLEKLRTARHEWRVASDELFRVRTAYEDASEIIVQEAATKERIALERYHHALTAYRELFGDFPFSEKDP